MPAYKKFQGLGSLTLDTFLSEYWQKKPLYCAQAFPDFKTPISADELAGYALEECLPSRLVLEHGAESWEVQHGPFAEDTFQKLPKQPWTLLVQHLDRIDPNIAALLEAFKFLPAWRLEDIMMSYANDQGGVGPHFDYYDVFLIQAEGTRRWKLGQYCDNTTPLLPNQSMKILADFQQSDDILMQAGDMLYVPPGLAHWGISEGEGMTISVGFRAPSAGELLLDFAEELSERLSDDQRYRDPSLSSNADPYEIPSQVLDTLQTTLRELCEDKLNLARSFGKVMTRPVLEFALDEDMEPFSQFHRIKLTNDARAAWVSEGDTTLLFVEGEDFTCDHELAIALANKQVVALSTLEEKSLALCRYLYEQGAVEPVA